MKFLVDRETKFLQNTEVLCRLCVADMHGIFGGYDRRYKLCPLIFEDKAHRTKYLGDDGKWMPLSMQQAYWNRMTALLDTQGMDMQPVRFVESEYLAFLEERGKDHSQALLQEWTTAMADRMYSAKET